MKTSVLLFLILSASILSAQESPFSSFTSKEIKRLNGFGIQTENYDLYNNQIQSDFSSILQVDQKRRSNDAWGISLTVVSVLSTTLGILMFDSMRIGDDVIGPGPYVVAGGALVGVGVVSGGFAIKLFNSSKKKEKTKQELIKAYQ